jgi:hypothetical protein
MGYRACHAPFPGDWKRRIAAPGLGALLRGQQIQSPPPQANVPRNPNGKKQSGLASSAESGRRASRDIDLKAHKNINDPKYQQKYYYGYIGDNYQYCDGACYPFCSATDGDIAAISIMSPTSAAFVASWLGVKTTYLFRAPGMADFSSHEDAKAQRSGRLNCATLRG